MIKKKTVEEQEDELEQDLIRVVALHQKVLDEFRAARAQRRLGKAPAEENRGESRDSGPLVPIVPARAEEHTTT